MHVIAEHLAQRGVHQVRRRVIPGDARPRLRVDLGRHHIAELELAVLHLTVVTEHVGLDFLRVVDRK